MSDQGTLVARAVQVDGRRLALSLAAGDGGRTIGRAACDLVQRHLATEAVGQADDHQAQMQQIGDQRKQRGFLPAMLGRAGGEGAADFAVQRAAGPKRPCPIHESGHLGGHAAIAGRGADDDRVIVGEVFDFGDGGGLVGFEMGGLNHVVGRGFRHALDIDRGTFLFSPFGDGVGHLLDMPVARIVKHQNLGH